MDEGVARDDAQQHVEKDRAGVEGEPLRRERIARSSAEDMCGEKRLHEVEEHARDENLTPAAGREDRRSDGRSE